MSSQRGDVAAKLLVLMVVLAVAAAVAAPWMLRSKRTNEEAAAIATLRSIHAAQTNYFGGGRLYGTMTKLREAKMIDGWANGKQFQRDGYRFYHATDGGYSRFCAEAVPEEAGKGKGFGIDETGIVYEFERNTAPCYLGVLTKTGGTPVR